MTSYGLMMMSYGLVMTGVVTLFPGILAYPNGPPVSRIPELCSSMIPRGHYTPSKTSHDGLPFEIKVFGGCYTPNTPLQVYVRLNESEPKNQPYFKGFFVMARKVNQSGLDTTSNVGTFMYDDPDIKGQTCFGVENSAVSHARAAPWTCKAFTWLPPSSLSPNFVFHNVVFQGVVVMQKVVYWMNLRSETLYPRMFCPQSDYSCYTEESNLGWGSLPFNPVPAGSDVIHARAYWMNLVFVIINLFL